MLQYFTAVIAIPTQWSLVFKMYPSTLLLKVVFSQTQEEGKKGYSIQIIILRPVKGKDRPKQKEMEFWAELMNTNRAAIQILTLILILVYFISVKKLLLTDSV